MRIAVIILVFLGVAAAACAVVLMRTLTLPTVGRSSASAAAEVEVFTVTKPLPAMSVVDGKVISPKKVKKADVPEGAMTSSVQFVGKVLTRPMVEGEPFTESCFATDGIGHYLAAALPPGKRAVSVQFRDHSAMAGLLYPGSVVDVLVSVQSPGGAAEAVATTLLQGAQVLAIGSQAVTSGQEFKDKNPGALNTKGQQTNTRMVTLLVTPKQAEILQLAAQYGVVSLAMRNPLDTAPVAQELTRISEFTNNAAARSGTNVIAAVASAFLAATKTRDEATPTTKPSAGDADVTNPEPADVVDVNPLWEMLVVRGNDSKTQTFPMPVEQTEVAQETADPKSRLDGLQPSLGIN